MVELTGDPLVMTGGTVGLVMAGFALLRKLGLKASEDLLTLKEDGVERGIIDRLQRIIDEQGEQIESIQATRARLLLFAVRSTGYIARCDCDDPEMVSLRQALIAECNEILSVPAGKKGGAECCPH